MTGPPKIKLPARMKEPIGVDEGEDLVLKVPYSGQPKPKVLPSLSLSVELLNIFHNFVYLS